MPTPIERFDYVLPEECIAQQPAEPRDSSRLLMMNRKTGAIRHHVFRDVLHELQPGDVLVMNDTKVFNARLSAKTATGSVIEVFLLKEMENGLWQALLRPGRKVKAGDVLMFENGLTAEKIENGPDGTVKIRFNASADTILQHTNDFGITPLPPYITEYTGLGERYQTVYATHSGSVAAPTAGLHFTPELLEAIRQKGVEIVHVTLHVGLGTFRPVQSDTLEGHTMHAEMVEVSEEVAEVINRAKQEGRRVIAVGTTTVRTLEGVAAAKGNVAAFSGEVNIFITPGFTFQIVDGIITNFHLPKSTLLVLVSAFAGREHVLAAYKEAIEDGYRFYSFGDAMFIV